MLQIRFPSVLTALMIMFSGLAALAQTADPAAGAANQPSTLEMLAPFLILFAVMYLFILRPQAKKQKELQKFIGAMKRGDEVVTTSGIMGKIESLTDAFVTLQVAPGVNIKVLRRNIEGSVQAMIPVAPLAAKIENKK